MFRDNAYLQTRFENGDVPDENDFIDVFDSFEKKGRTVTLDAAGETIMLVRYQGDTPPTLGKTANGEYTLTTGPNTGSVSIEWDGVGATANGNNSVILKIKDGDGGRRHFLGTVFQKANGDELSTLDGVRRRYGIPAATETTIEFPNIANASGGWLIIGALS